MNYTKTAMLLAAMTAIFMGAGWLIGGGAGMIIALVIAIVTNGIAFWGSDSLALSMHKARAANRSSHPELFEIVEDLSIRADLPMPEIYVIDTPQPNAFATGRDPEHASVAATTGLLRSLSREELAGVMAHELAHIRNRDTLIMTVAATVAGAISMLAQFAFWFGRGRDRGPLGIVGVLVAALFAPFAAMLVQMLISRTREYAADRAGAEICGQPLWLASALKQIASASGRIEMESAERNPASAHMFIINPLSGQRFDSLFSTHPNVNNRIEALEAMAGGRMPEPINKSHRSRIPSVRRRK